MGDELSWTRPWRIATTKAGRSAGWRVRILAYLVVIPSLLALDFFVWPSIGDASLESLASISAVLVLSSVVEALVRRAIVRADAREGGG